MVASRVGRWAALTCLVCVALVAATWFLLIGPRRAQAAELADQQVQAEAQNHDLERKIEELKAQFAELPQAQAELADFRREMPAEVDMPRLVRQLHHLASVSGVSVLAITPGEAEPASGAAPGADPAAQPAAQPAGQDGQAPVPGSSAPSDQLIAIPITVSLRGDYFQAALFIKQVQTKLDRAFLVSSVDVVKSVQGEPAEGSAEDGAVDLTLNGRVFLLPESPDQGQADQEQADQAQAPAAEEAP
jgi:type IV pilus assembly protein PilO